MSSHHHQQHYWTPVTRWERGAVNVSSAAFSQSTANMVLLSSRPGLTVKPSATPPLVWKWVKAEGKQPEDFNDKANMITNVTATDETGQQEEAKAEEEEGEGEQRQGGGDGDDLMED